MQTVCTPRCRRETRVSSAQNSHICENKRPKELRGAQAPAQSTEENKSTLHMSTRSRDASRAKDYEILYLMGEDVLELVGSYSPRYFSFLSDLVRATQGRRLGNVQGPPPPNHRGTHVAPSCNRAFSCRQEDCQSIALWKLAQQDPAGLCTFSPSSGPARAHVLIVHRHSILTT